MVSKIIISVLSVLVLIAYSQQYQIFYGTNQYTQVETGDLNILITTPHDGLLFPPSISNRTSDPLNNIVGDTNTGIIARAIRDSLQQMFQADNNKMGVRPYLVGNNIARIKMDPNRNSTACCQNPLTEDSGKAFNDFHGFIKNYFGTFMASSQYKLGLIVDVHGQAHPEGWIELGYLLDPSTFNNPLKDSLASQSSLSKLKQQSSQSFEELIRGNTYSMGGILNSKFPTYKAVPSPTNLSTNGGNYFNGGYITQTYAAPGSYDNFKIAGFQMELPQVLRLQSNASLAILGQNLASCIYQFYRINSFDKVN